MDLKKKKKKLLQEQRPEQSFWELDGPELWFYLCEPRRKQAQGLSPEILSERKVQ